MKEMLRPTVTKQFVHSASRRYIPGGEGVKLLTGCCGQRRETEKGGGGEEDERAGMSACPTAGSR